MSITLYIDRNNDGSIRGVYSNPPGEPKMYDIYESIGGDYSIIPIELERALTSAYRLFAYAWVNERHKIIEYIDLDLIEAHGKNVPTLADGKYIYHQMAERRDGVWYEHGYRTWRAEVYTPKIVYINKDGEFVPKFNAEEENEDDEENEGINDITNATAFRIDQTPGSLTKSVNKKN